MKVEHKAEKNPCVINLTVKANPDEIKGEVRKVLNEFLREAQIPGFRKGKVPVELIRKNFANELKRETEGACFRAFYPKAVEESKLKVIALEGVTEMKADVKSLAGKPGTRWEKLTETVIGIVVGALLALMFSQIGM